MGNQSLLAFFEYPPDAPRGNRDALGGMQHLPSIRTARTLKASARSTFRVKAAHGHWEITDKGGSHLKAAAS